MSNFAPVPTIGIEQAQAGDIVTCDGKGLTSALIKFGEWIKSLKNRSLKPFRKWSHDALLHDFTDGEWFVHQATAKGVVRSPLSEVTKGKYEIIPLTAFPTLDGWPAVRGDVLASSDKLLGDKYSFLGILSIALNMLTPSNFVFGDSDHVVCSAHVARCMEHAGVWIGRNPYSQTPADNAQLAHFEAIKRAAKNLG